MRKRLREKKKRIFDIIQIGYFGDFASILFDVVMTAAILCNLFLVVFETFEVSANYRGAIRVLEGITVAGFTVEYILRVWTAEYLYPRLDPVRARWKYVLSFTGIVDLLSFLPFYLPLIFPSGIVAFRMFRVIRVLRLFRVNRYYDAFNVISDVIRRKRSQIVSSVFIILVLMLASSLCMYSLEHEAQPEVFRNAFSGFWWSVSTLLTVGYGDIYPITVAGRIFGIIITFLGVGMVAIPTGILSAGFVEQYAMLKESADYLLDEDLRFIRLQIGGAHPWAGKKISELDIPPGMILAVIQKPDGGMVLPRGDTVIGRGDALVIGAENSADGSGGNPDRAGRARDAGQGAGRGAEQDAGRGAGRSAGRDAGRGAGRSVGQDAVRGTGRDVGRGARAASAVTLREIILGEHHPWADCKIRDLDISRQTLIVMIRRGGETVIPDGNTVLRSRDEVFLCTKKNMADARVIRV